MDWLYVYLALGACCLAVAINNDNTGELFGPGGEYPLRVKLIGSTVVVFLWPAIVGAAAVLALIQANKQ
jgi:hypothetical protein